MSAERARSERGATLVEYALAVAVAVIVLVGALDWVRQSSGQRLAADQDRLGAPAEANGVLPPAMAASPGFTGTIPTTTTTLPNVPPAAGFVVACVATSCTFTSTSTDVDGTIVTLRWSNPPGGSGTVAAGNINPTQTPRVVVLEVVDDRGGVDTAQTTVTCTTVAGVTTCGAPPAT